MRCDTEDKSKVKFFDPFCPKILATRKTFTDKAVESRCITKVMTGTMRRDIPFNINQSFWEEREKICNKLLMWRFKNFDKINLDCKINFDIHIEPRVQQVVSSLYPLFAHDEKQQDIEWTKTGYTKHSFRHIRSLHDRRKKQ